MGVYVGLERLICFLVSWACRNQRNDYFSRFGFWQTACWHAWFKQFYDSKKQTLHKGFLDACDPVGVFYIILWHNEWFLLQFSGSALFGSPLWGKRTIQQILISFWMQISILLVEFVIKCYYLMLIRLIFFFLIFLQYIALVWNNVRACTGFNGWHAMRILAHKDEQKIRGHIK